MEPDLAADRKKGAPLAVTITVLLGLVLAGGFFAYRVWRASQGPIEVGPPIVEERDPFREFMRRKNRGVLLCNRAAELRTSEDDVRYTRRLGEAKQHFQTLLEDMNRELDPYRDPETGELPPDLSGYNEIYDAVNTYLGDLVKATPF